MAKGDQAESAKTPAAGPLREYAVGRATARAARIGGIGKAGILPSVVATGGLVLLRRHDRTVAGAALLALAGGLSWLAGRRWRQPK